MSLLTAPFAYFIIYLERKYQELLTFANWMTFFVSFFLHKLAAEGLKEE